MKFLRRNFLHLAAGAAAPLAISRIAWAQTYPTRLVTIVVPFAPGGTTDVSARIVAEHMSRTLGQQFIIEPCRGPAAPPGQRAPCAPLRTVTRS
jgi:tripartite-type tricarboxylate transporter receptor subunit TctC